MRAPRRGLEGDRAARVEDVSLAYLPRNVAPEIVSVQTLPVGIALLPAVQVPVDPNLESSGLDPSLFGAPVQVPPRRTFQRGAVSLQWQAEDRNGDQLEYSVFYRAVSESVFRPLRERQRENFLAVDGAALGDGRFVFKIVATDAPDNAVGQALRGERLSEPVDIDNSPPRVRADAQTQTQPAGMPRSLRVEDAGGWSGAPVSIERSLALGLPRRRHRRQPAGELRARPARVGRRGRAHGLAARLRRQRQRQQRESRRPALTFFASGRI